MKISGRKSVGRSTPMQGASSRGANRPPEDSTPKLDSIGPSFGVSISGASQLLASARTTIATMPDVRIERVDEVRLSLDDGSYHVESRVLAKRMVDEALRESARQGRRRS